MKIAIGTDHAGYELKEYLKEYLKSKNIEVLDFGCDSTESVDYPDYAIKVADYIYETIEQYARNIDDAAPNQSPPHTDSEKAILICGSGSGMCIAANKVREIRAVNCYTPEIASLAVRHNNANILCLGARFISKELAKEIVDSFLAAKFEAGRHLERIDEIHIRTGV